MKLPTALQCSITALLLSIALSTTTVHAASSQNNINKLQGDIKKYEIQKGSLNQELEFTHVKLQSTHDKLSQLQHELRTKEIQLEKLKAAIGDKPTPEQRDFISNESKRIDLGATAIKSRKAAISRLERKETDLSKKIARTETLLAKAQKGITTSKQDAQAANSAKAYRMQRELAELKKENEQLRLAMAEEAARTRSATAEALLLAQAHEAAVKETERLTEEKALAEAAAIAKEAAKNKKLLAQDQSQTVLPGEKPIYKKSDGRKVVIRNRGKKKSFVMRPLGDKVYEVEVELSPGKSYFDIRSRRYRGYFPESRGDTTYVFRYDLSDKKHPKLSVKEKVDDPNQMISNANAPF